MSNDRSEPRREEHAFLVRSWREPGAGPPTWRGVVEHLESRRRYYFSEPSELATFVARWMKSDS